MAVTQETTCTVCGKASTTRCGGCLEGVDHHGQPSPTYYCGKDCQKAHWTEHKNECKLANARKVLYRGGELLQKAYYAFREEAFDLLLCEVRKEGRHLHVYEGVWEDRRVLVRYPHHLVSDPIDKQALLSHRACTDAVAHTYQLSRKVFEGIYTTIVEARFQMPHDSALVIFHRGNGNVDTNFYKHQGLIIKLRDGMQYVVDLAGAQYGQHQPVVLWEDYQASISGLVETRIHGFTNIEMHDKYASLPNPTVGELVPLVQAEVRKCLETAVENWEQRAGQGLAQMLKSSTVDEYLRHSDELLTEVREDMRDFIQWAEANGKWGYTSGNQALSGPNAKPKEHTEKAFLECNDGTSKATQDLATEFDGLVVAS